MRKDSQLARYREMWSAELAGAALYRGLAEHADDEAKARIYRALAESEERHAAHWATQLRAAGVTDLRPPRVPFRVRALRRLAGWLGTDAILPIVLRAEAADADKYAQVAEAPDAMARQEAAHGKVVAALRGGSTGGRIAASEGRHRAGVGGALRAAVFGVNDGLVSNFSLVMGVAGGTSDNSIVLLAGVAGLVAGAFSMASGEWISVRSQRELYENELRIEREEIQAFPDEEREELELIYQAKGVDPQEAKAVVDDIMSRPDVALETLAREELGLDPGALGSPWTAAGSSFLAFALGAVLPVVPFIVGGGGAAVVVAAAASLLALFGVGAVLSVFTARPAGRSGARMAAIGALVATATFVVGSAVGAGVS